jgi:hypothetical protein
VEILFQIKKEKMQSNFIVLLLALLACVLAQAADKNRVKSKRGLGIGDWGLGIGPNPQSPIPNPQNQLKSQMLEINLNK